MVGFQFVMLNPDPDNLVYPPTNIIENTPAAVSPNHVPTNLYFPYLTKTVCLEETKNFDDLESNIKLNYNVNSG